MTNPPIWLVFFYSALFITAGYNLLLFFLTRQKAYSYYALYVFGYTMFYLTLDGLAYQYLWPNFPRWNAIADTVFIGLTLFALLKSSQEFMLTKTLSPRWHRILSATIIVTAVLSLITIFMGNRIINLAAYVALPIVGITLAFSARAVKRKGHKLIRAMPLVWTPAAIGLILLYLNQLGVLPGLAIAEPLFRLGMLWQFFFGPIIFAYQINLFRQEREEAQGRALEAEQKNKRLLEEQNITLERKVQERTTELGAANEALKQAAAQRERLAVLEERERIGQDLHDDLGQVMGYINLQAQAAQELLKQKKTAQVRDTLTKLIQASQEAHGDLRRYILGIRDDENASEEAAPLDLMRALNEYLGQLKRRYGLQTQISLPEGVYDLPLTPEVGTQLLRIIQEALTNIRKHAGGNLAQLYFFVDAQQIQVVIEDKGRGFEQELGVRDWESGIGEQSLTPNLHFGLEIMRERAEKVGGSLKVRSTIGQGTRVVAQLPRMITPSAESRDAAAGLRILLVDDHPLFQEGLRAMLNARGLHVVGSASDGIEAQEMAHNLLPDVILMDVEMPRCNGVQATQRIKAEYPDMKIVMLTVAADDETLFAALKAGASGYLLKNLQGDEFYNLLRALAKDEAVLSPGLAARMLAEFRREKSASPSKPDMPLPKDPTNFPELSARQIEILDLAAQGLTYKEIGAKIYLSERTVRYHMGQILQALHLKNRREAVAYARQKGLGAKEEDSIIN